MPAAPNPLQMVVMQAFAQHLLEESGGVNLYGFCHNDGVNLVDPTGRCYGDVMPDILMENLPSANDQVPGFDLAQTVRDVQALNEQGYVSGRDGAPLTSNNGDNQDPLPPLSQTPIVSYLPPGGSGPVIPYSMAPVTITNGNSSLSTSQSGNSSSTFIGASIGGTAFIPAVPASPLGIGFSASGSTGVLIDNQNLGDSRLQISVSVSALFGTEVALFGGLGPTVGYSPSTQQGGWSSDITNHTEGGLGFGGVASTAVDWKNDGSVSVSPPTTPVQFNQREGAGVAAYGAVGSTGSVTWTSPSINEVTNVLHDIIPPGPPQFYLTGTITTNN